MDFGDLVASAEQLTAEIDGGRAGDLPRVERSLKHLLEAGQSLLGQRGQGQDAKASILLGSRGVDLPAIASKIGAIQSTNILTESEKVTRSLFFRLWRLSGLFHGLPQVHPTDIPAFLKAEREEAILGLLEETKRETVESLTSRHWDCVVREWERDKARILSAVAAGGGGAGADMTELSLARDLSTSFVSRTRDSAAAATSSRPGDTTLVTSALSHHELVYARAVVTYNSSVAAGGVRPDLLAMMADLWAEDREPEVSTVWDMVRAMAELGTERASNDIVSCAKKYLEKSYIKFIRYAVVNRCLLLI